MPLVCEREERAEAANFCDLGIALLSRGCAAEQQHACLPYHLPVPPAIRPFHLILSRYCWELE